MARLPIALFFSASRSKNWSSLALSSVWAWPAVNSASVSEIVNNVLILIRNRLYLLPLHRSPFSNLKFAIIPASVSLLQHFPPVPFVSSAHFRGHPSTHPQIHSSPSSAHPILSAPPRRRPSPSCSIRVHSLEFAVSTSAFSLQPSPPDLPSPFPANPFFRPLSATSPSAFSAQPQSSLSQPRSFLLHLGVDPHDSRRLSRPAVFPSHSPDARSFL